MSMTPLFPNHDAAFQIYANPITAEQNKKTATEKDHTASVDFHTHTSLLDKAGNVAQIGIFALSSYALYAYMTGGTGLLVKASYVSLGLTIRKVTATAIGVLACPATIACHPILNKEVIALGNAQIAALKSKNYIVKHITLHKSGTKFDAYEISRQDLNTNGKWNIHALGNSMAMEDILEEFATLDSKDNANSLFINGPAVSKSKGWPTRYQMGAAFETGITYLEQQAKATHIIMRGFSLGGGMLAEAILQHDFTEGMKKGIKYLSISDRTFSRLSTVADPFIKPIASNIGDALGNGLEYLGGRFGRFAGSYMGRARSYAEKLGELTGKVSGFVVKGIGNHINKIVTPLCKIVDAELDGVKAARKLSQLHIRHIIIQHSSTGINGTDGVIPTTASLAYALHKELALSDKVFLESPQIHHIMPYPNEIQTALTEQIRDFLKE